MSILGAFLNNSKFEANSLLTPSSPSLLISSNILLAFAEVSSLLLSPSIKREGGGGGGGGIRLAPCGVGIAF